MRTSGPPMNIGTPPLDAQVVEDAQTRDALSPLAERGIVRTQTRHQVAMRVPVPRDLDDVRMTVIKEATYSRDGWYYQWTVKDKNSESGQSIIRGTSIEGAMVLLRNWGNAAAEVEVVEETGTHWIFRATIIDLEKGFAMPRLFRQRKSESHGDFDRERALDIAFQIGQSKAIRNAIIRCVPQWLVDEAMDAAMDAHAARYADVLAAVDAVKKYARGIGISETQLQRKAGKSFADWVPSDVALIRSIFNAIQQGQTSIGQEFSADPPPEPVATDPAPEAKAPAKTATQSAPEPGPSPAPQEAGVEEDGDLDDDIPFGKAEAPKQDPAPPSFEPPKRKGKRP